MAARKSHWPLRTAMRGFTPWACNHCLCRAGLLQPLIRRHGMSLCAGVITATVVAVTSSVWLARLLMLSTVQRRAVTTPFALAAAQPMGGQADLVASLVMMLSGVVMVLVAPLVAKMLF